jgi:hypothetical protein
MTANNKSQSAPSFTWKLEAIVLLGVGGICLIIYLSLIGFLLVSSSKVAHAPSASASADHTPTRSIF